MTPPWRYFFCGSFHVLCLLCLCVRHFLCALWSPAGKGLTSWLSFVVSNCMFITFPLVSRVLIFTPLLTFKRSISMSWTLYQARFLIFDDFSRSPLIFKYFSSLWEPCLCTMHTSIYYVNGISQLNSKLHPGSKPSKPVCSRNFPCLLQ